MRSSGWQRAFETLWNGQRSVFFFRNVTAVAIAAVACVVPEFGPGRFWLAAILVFLCVPVATLIERRVSVAENAWVQPLFDLTALVVLIHTVPDMWIPGLVIGLMVVQAPSIAESHASTLFYAAFATILTVGMTVAAVVHDVPNWELPILAMVVLYPSVIFYSHRQSVRANEIRERARALDGLHLVAGGVAHDFNNVLTGVLGHAELALAEIEPRHPAAESLDEVIHGAERAALLSARLLAFSGRAVVEDETLDVGAEIEGIVALMATVVPKGITLLWTAPEEPAFIEAQRAKFQQVLMNLILNASEASAPPASVRIDLGADGEATVERRLKVTVADDGSGIGTEAQSRIFDPFFTLKEHGHGLGLANARSIVSELGGRLHVRSAPGRGTVMTVELPRLDAASAASQAGPPAPRGRTRPGTALVVDDEAAVRTVLGRLLRRLGYTVLEADGGSDAVAQFEARGADIDVVLLDLRMPGMDGWQCLRALRELRANVPILVCSGHDPFVGVERPRDALTGFLAKPVRTASLEDALERLQDSGEDR